MAMFKCLHLCAKLNNNIFSFSDVDTGCARLRMKLFAFMGKFMVPIFRMLEA